MLMFVDLKKIKSLSWPWKAGQGTCIYLKYKGKIIEVLDPPLIYIRQNSPTGIEGKQDE